MKVSKDFLREMFYKLETYYLLAPTLGLEDKVELAENLLGQIYEKISK